MQLAQSVRRKRAGIGRCDCSGADEYRRDTTVLLRQNRKEDERRTLSENAQSEWLCRVIAKGTKAIGVHIPLHDELTERGLTPEEAFALSSWLHSWRLFDEQQIDHIDNETMVP